MAAFCNRFFPLNGQATQYVPPPCDRRVPHAQHAATARDKVDFGERLLALDTQARVELVAHFAILVLLGVGHLAAAAVLRPLTGVMAEGGEVRLERGLFGRARDKGPFDAG